MTKFNNLKGTYKCIIDKHNITGSGGLEPYRKQFKW